MIRLTSFILWVMLSMIGGDSIFGMAFLGWPQSVAAGEPLKILFYDSFAPFSWAEDHAENIEEGEAGLGEKAQAQGSVENHNMQGILIDVISEALGTRAGIEIKIEGTGWPEAQQRVREGLADALITIPTPARRLHLKFSGESAIVSEMSVFANPANTQISKLRNISNIRHLRGWKSVNYKGNGWARENLAKLGVNWVADITTALESVASGNSDVFVQTAAVAQYHIARMGLNRKIERVGGPLAASPFKLGIGDRPERDRVLSMFDGAIVAMERDGTLKRIHAKYR